MLSQALDATANPYIALAALVTAGMAGMRAGALLPAPVAGDPASLSSLEAAAIGLVRLPSSLAAAIECLLTDEGALSPAMLP